MVFVPFGLLIHLIELTADVKEDFLLFVKSFFVDFHSCRCRCRCSSFSLLDSYHLHDLLVHALIRLTAMAMFVTTMIRHFHMQKTLPDRLMCPTNDELKN